jgi:hypothetical protein
MHAMTNDGSLPLTGIVLVEEKSVYGNPLLYPANDLARALIALSGNTTLTIAAIVLIKAMGFRIVTNGTDPKEI